MKTFITSSSAHVLVDGAPATTPYIPTNVNNPLQGMIRCIDNQYQIFTGSVWQHMTDTYATVRLSQSADAALNWVNHKMQEEKQIEELCEKFPAIKLAHENALEANSKLNLMIKLSSEY